MPVPTNACYEQSINSTPMNNTPSRFTSNIRSAPSTSYSPTVTGNGQQKLNVVTRIAVEGKAKKGQDGASIRMFLKICVPVETVTPGTTVPLFAEENVKIHSSQVHPLDHHSIPYNFSSTVSPLLHNAARALNLPARSQDDFMSVFNIARSNGNASTSRSLKSESGESIPPVDAQYTGHIIVSGYSISFVLPKIFLSRRDHGRSPLSDDDDNVAQTPASRRRASIAEKNQAQFMAAIDMWVPFISKPPRSPYLLTIPTPRCLHNHIKLRIFPPANTATSFASLSSIEDDSTAWDLTSDPHVSRIPTKPSRSHSYTQFADDESSDTSVTNMSEGCIVQGTFPSAERIRIRWAKPIKNLNIPEEENSRRRVGVEEVKGEMSCIIRGKGISANDPEIEGVLMHVEYKGQCKGVWFPGVATLLGLDVGLEAKGSDICWPKGHPTQWDVSGGAGYTGFDCGTSSPANPSSRTSSLDSNTPRPQMHASASREQDSVPFLTDGRRASGFSTSSLLRAPLPAQNVAEYSFEGSNATLPSSSGMLSSISSLPASSTPILPLPHTRPPGSPITLHLNMNDLQPPVKNVLTFNITGTILVTARTTLARVNAPNSSSSSDKSTDPEPVVLPRFTVLAADSEVSVITVRNEAEAMSVEVFHPIGDIYNDPQTRKTVLQKGGFTRCGEDGGRIALKTLDAFNMTTNGPSRHMNRARTPSTSMLLRVSSNSPIPRTNLPSRSKHDGPATIPWAKATVTALAPDATMFPTGYAVRICLQTPALNDSEWLEFGMAHGWPSDPGTIPTDRKHNRKVHIICATVDGVPVRANTTKAAKTESGVTVAGVPFEEQSGRDWICWGKVYTGGSPGCSMVIDYLVKEDDPKLSPGSERMASSLEMTIILPTFFISVARLEVKIDVMPGLEILSLRSNFDYHHAYPKGNRLLRYSLEAFSQPQLLLLLRKMTAKVDPTSTTLKRYFITTWIIGLVAFCSLFRVLYDLGQLRQVVDGDRFNPQIDSRIEIPTVTVTSTVHDIMETQRQFSEASTTPLRSTYPQSAFSETSLTDIITTTFSASSTPRMATQTPKQRSSHTAQDQRSILEHFGLVPVDNLFNFTWADEYPYTLKRTMAKVVATMEVVWNIFRKVYHYPLDPP
ncbi:hypothetical protein BDN70DRAFT_874609 [Pholiota conissans]|uniref:Uncharacterized protein n=1 Tax=Pholiota conissans TaxID=109636 RepID=A0A9P5ZA91_9AGAR|nr:hypothetical protein BDN70DRAFT_874609 [Pholiota conissans]